VLTTILASVASASSLGGYKRRSRYFVEKWPFYGAKIELGPENSLIFSLLGIGLQMTKLSPKRTLAFLNY
jgi:hypothetical protein